jgi:HprK-related kinase A
VAQHFYLRTGPFKVHVATASREVAASIRALYDPKFLLPKPDFCDFHVEMVRPVLRRWIKPEVLFLFDGHAPFLPGPRRHAPAMFEWGLNWVIATMAHRYLSIHAAVVERNGLALILPGPPGSGKSTLCTGLVFRGWRLLSDELTLVRPEDGELVALVRPISLKNDSIDIISRFAPHAVFGPRVRATSKGTIALVKPPAASIDAIDVTARPRWVVFPKYQKGAAGQLAPRSKAGSFVQLGDSAMNYSVLGELGFKTLADLIDRCEVYDFVYEDLDRAVELFTHLADTVAGRVSPAVALAVP